jgi:hypothetical protein
MKTRVGFQVLYVLNAAGREIVYDIDLITTLEVSIRKMRPDKPGSTCNQDSQYLSSLLK